MLKRLLCFIVPAILITGTAFAAHPLITDDTGTQGKGKFQLELNGEYGSDNNDGVLQHTTPTASALTYGLNDSLDISIGVPYEWIKTDDPGSTASRSGFGDPAISAKWRFYDKKGLSFALKPGITLPTGDKDIGIGTGKMTYSLFLITTREMEPWAFHLNLGYIANENRLDQRVPIWHASIASELEIAKGLRLVANTGIQRNTDKGAHTDPAFILGGLIYSITENIDVDAGYKYGLTKPEVDNMVLAGITFRF